MDDNPLLLALFVGTILLSVAVMLGIQVYATHTAFQIEPGREIDSTEGLEGSGERTIKRRPGSSDLRRRREEDARREDGGL